MFFRPMCVTKESLKEMLIFFCLSLLSPIGLISYISKCMMNFRLMRLSKESAKTQTVCKALTRYLGTIKSHSAT